MQTPRQTLDKSPLLLCLCLPQNNTILFKGNICRKKVQYYTNICLHGHLHNYYQKVVIQATVISAHLATFEATQKGDIGQRPSAVSHWSIFAAEQIQSDRAEKSGRC